MLGLRIFVGIFLCGIAVCSKQLVHADDDGLLVRLKVGAHPSEMYDFLRKESIKSKNELLSGGRTILVIEPIDPQTQFLLEKHPVVDLVEPNTRMMLDDPLLEQTRESQITNTDLNHRDFRENISAEIDIDDCEERGVLGENGTWGLTRISHRSRPNFNFDKYEYKLNGSGVDIYIMDSGIEIEHVDFSGRASHGYVVDSLRDREGYTDYIGHGTHVASIAGGSLYGIASGANLISVKVLGFAGSTSFVADLIEGFSYIVERVRQERSDGKRPRVVVNLSVHGSTVFSEILYDAVEEAVQERIIVIAAGGNTGNTVPNYPASFNNVISIGATDIDDSMASVSTYGQSIDINAPGASILAAYSSETLRCAGETPHECVTRAGGTARSTPMVCGIVARYLEQLTESELSKVFFAGLLDMLVETATVDAITFTSSQRNAGTPNRLLFMECDHTDFELPEPCWNCHHSGASIFYFKPILFLATIFVQTIVM